MDIIASTLGALLVLVVGTIWRRSKLANADHAAVVAAETGAPGRADLP
jgi:hypothetical protein